MAEFASQQLEYDYRRAIEALNVYRSLFSDHGAGAAEAFHVADLGLYRRLYRTAMIGRRRRRSARPAENGHGPHYRVSRRGSSARGGT